MGEPQHKGTCYKMSADNAVVVGPIFSWVNAMPFDWFAFTLADIVMTHLLGYHAGSQTGKGDIFRNDPLHRELRVNFCLRRFAPDF